MIVLGLYTADPTPNNKKALDFGLNMVFVRLHFINFVIVNYLNDKGNPTNQAPVLFVWLLKVTQKQLLSSCTIRARRKSLEAALHLIRLVDNANIYGLLWRAPFHCACDQGHMDTAVRLIEEMDNLRECAF